MTDFPSHIRALLSLLDDPDPVVQVSVRARFLELGDIAVPALRMLIDTEGTEASALQNARETLRDVGCLRFGAAFDGLANGMIFNGDVDLEQGAFAIAYLHYPELNAGAYIQQLDTMASMLESRLHGCDNGYMVIRELNRYLVDQLGFHGCRQDRNSYYDPENSFLNRVMDRRMGNPVGLSVVYLLVANRLGLPLEGVGFPSHFMLKYRSLNEEFFVDPFNGGQILNYSDCRRFLRGLGIDYRPEFLEAIPNRRIVARMMRNLAEILREENPIITRELEGRINVLLDEQMPGR